MSKYASTFILLNLGSEMLYVVSQRLQAQGISAERSNQVLDEITSALINQRMLTDLMQNPNLEKTEMKDRINKIAQSSIMRLDAVSMDRLWDLITMVFKWQINVGRDTFLVTIRHLYEIETFVTTPATQLNLHRVQNTVDNFAKVLTNEEKREMFDVIVLWLRDFDVRVSLLLRLGFQRADGSFNDRIGGESGGKIAGKYAGMLDNLGENIYAAAKQLNINENVTNAKGNAKDNAKVTAKPENSANAGLFHELDTIYDQLNTGNTPDTSVDKAQFKLTLCDTFDTISTISPDTCIYSQINVAATNTIKNSKCFDGFDVFDVFDAVHGQETQDIHEELLNMLDEPHD